MNSSGDGARRSLRFSFSRFNSDAQIDRAIEIMPKVIDKLRQLSAPARESAQILQEAAGIAPEA
jgi:cysteine desulfurase